VAIVPIIPASAAVIETVSIENYYGFSPGEGTGAGSQMGSGREQFFVPSSTNGPSELGIDYTAFANKDGFFFLHQNYCIGTCSTFSNTTITFALTNTGSEAVALRFDSLITPGHLSLVGSGVDTAGSFNFYVSQSADDATTRLYEASGNVSRAGLQLDTGSITFNDLATNVVPGSDAQVVDWGATTLSLPLLQIGANSTSFVTYSATYSVRNNNTCVALTNCSSAEIVFGDPRNNGGITGRALADVTQPQVGGSYSPYLVPFSFVPVDAPPPGDPPAKTPVTYLPFNQSNAGVVPEPATWAMMIFGFAGVGLAMRRRVAILAR
jgi:hypothetical protein